jgi:hypothetical protein
MEKQGIALGVRPMLPLFFQRTCSNRISESTIYIHPITNSMPLSNKRNREVGLRTIVLSKLDSPNRL